MSHPFHQDSLSRSK